MLTISATAQFTTMAQFTIAPRVMRGLQYNTVTIKTKHGNPREFSPDFDIEGLVDRAKGEPLKVSATGVLYCEYTMDHEVGNYTYRSDLTLEFTFVPTLFHDMPIKSFLIGDVWCILHDGTVYETMHTRHVSILVNIANDLKHSKKMFVHRGDTVGELHIIIRTDDGVTITAIVKFKRVQTQ